MSFMTRIPNYPDRNDVRAGMASFEGTGPPGKICESCAHRGYYRTSSKPKFNTKTEMLEETKYRSKGCEIFLKLSHRHGPPIDKKWCACKYFEARKGDNHHA